VSSFSYHYQARPSCSIIDLIAFPSGLRSSSTSRSSQRIRLPNGFPPLRLLITPCYEVQCLNTWRISSKYNQLPITAISLPNWGGTVFPSQARAIPQFILFLAVAAGFNCFGQCICFQLILPWDSPWHSLILRMELIFNSLSLNYHHILGVSIQKLLERIPI